MNTNITTAELFLIADALGAVVRSALDQIDENASPAIIDRYNQALVAQEKVIEVIRASKK